MDTAEAVAELGEIRETLLVACKSAEPYSLRVVDPSSGTSLWSFKGVGDGGSIGHAELVGPDYDLLAIAQSAMPTVHLIGRLQLSRSSPTNSTVAGVVGSLASHPSGELLHCSVDSRVYTWMVNTGELLSVAGEDGVGEISAMRVSKCGTYLVAGCANGSVVLYLAVELMRSDARCRHSYSPHTSNVADVHITAGVQNPRVLSVSADRSMVLYSVSAKQALLRSSSDLPLSACCMDPGECRAFLGTQSGKICALDLFANSSSQGTGGSGARKRAAVFYNQHTASISRLAVNNDGTRLASGDCQGVYCIWDIGTEQCLRMATMKGEIVQLAFILNWASPNNGKGMRPKRKMTTLSTTLSDPQSAVFTKRRVRSKTAQEVESALDEHLDSEIARLRNRPATEGRSDKGPTDSGQDSTAMMDVSSPVGNAPSQDTPTSTARIRELEQEVRQLKSANRELFAYALQLAKEGGKPR